MDKNSPNRLDTKGKYMIKRDGYSVLVGSLGLYFILGTFHSIGGYLIYLISYLKGKNTELSFELSTFIYPLMTISSNFFPPFIEKYITNSVHIKDNVFYGSMYLSLCYFLLSFSQNIWIYYIIYIIFLAPVYGLLLTAVIRCLQPYYPSRMKNITSILHLSNGFGAAIFTIIAFLMNNPDNLDP